MIYSLKKEKTTICPHSSFFFDLIAMYEQKSIGRARRLLNIIVCKVMKRGWTSADFIQNFYFFMLTEGV